MIAKKFQTTAEALVRINHISNPNLIYPGQVLQISSTRNKTYTVQSGDALSLIVLKLGISMEQLIQKNNLANPDLIYAGQVLHYD